MKFVSNHDHPSEINGLLFVFLFRKRGIEVVQVS